VNRNITIGVVAVIVVAIALVGIIYYMIHTSKAVANAAPRYSDLLGKFNSSSFNATYIFHVRTMLIENNTVVANQSTIMNVAYSQVGHSSFTISITQNGNTTRETATQINASYYKVCVTYSNGTSTCNTEPSTSISSPIYGVLAVLNVTQYNYTRSITVLGNNAYCYSNSLNTTAPSIYGLEAIAASDLNCLYLSGVPAYASFNLTEALYPQGSTVPFALQSSSVTATLTGTG
jgi:hypothetical protein